MSPFRVALPFRRCFIILATLVMSWDVYTGQSRWVWASVSASRKCVGPYCLAGLSGPHCLWCWGWEAVWGGREDWPSLDASLGRGSVSRLL